MLHHMTHYKSFEHDKFKCPRCDNNYSSFRSLKDHAGNDKCKITSDFPPAQFYIDKCLKLHRKQDIKATVCSKCGKDSYKAPYDCQSHFMSCVKMAIPCLKCGREFVAYPNARLHYESCTNTGKDNKKPNFIDQVKPPNDNDDKEWSYAMMLDYMHEQTVEKLEALFGRYPEGAMGIIGMTGDRMGVINLLSAFPSSLSSTRDIALHRRRRIDSLPLLESPTRFDVRVPSPATHNFRGRRAL